MPPASSSTDIIDNGNNEQATNVKKTKIGDIVDVTIHPLVLLSAADHYHRVARGTRKRVVGVLLGTVHRGKVDASNSFAVPFEEDSKNPAVFYLDHVFLESMLHMFRKVNAKERVVGFYSTGPSIRPNDLRIYDTVSRFLPKVGSGSDGTGVGVGVGGGGGTGLGNGNVVVPPVFCIIDIRPDRKSLPTTAYKVVEEISTKDGQRQVQMSFAHVPSQMGALEAEEVGVEHLLRDINDPTVSTVASLIKGKMAGLATLKEKLLECQEYLFKCAQGRTKVHPEIVANLQTILNLLPNLNEEDLVRSMIIKTNDMHMAIYLSALIRSVLALHDLVNNRIRYGEHGTELEENKENSKETTKDKDGKDAKATSTSEEEKKEDKDPSSSKESKKDEKK